METPTRPPKRTSPCPAMLKSALMILFVGFILAVSARQAIAEVQVLSELTAGCMVPNARIPLDSPSQEVVIAKQLVLVDLMKVCKSVCIGLPTCTFWEADGMTGNKCNLFSSSITDSRVVEAENWGSGSNDCAFAGMIGYFREGIDLERSLLEKVATPSEKVYGVEACEAYIAKSGKEGFFYDPLSLECFGFDWVDVQSGLHERKDGSFSLVGNVAPFRANLKPGVVKEQFSAVGEIVTLGECLRLCASTHSCVAYSFNERESTCHLSNSTEVTDEASSAAETGTIKDAMRSMGCIVNGFTMGNNSNDVLTVNADVADVAECRLLCVEAEECFYFNYDSSAAKCELLGVQGILDNEELDLEDVDSLYSGTLCINRLNVTIRADRDPDAVQYQKIPDPHELSVKATTVTDTVTTCLRGFREPTHSDTFSCEAAAYDFSTGECFCMSDVNVATVDGPGLFELTGPGRDKTDLRYPRTKLLTYEKDITTTTSSTSTTTTVSTCAITTSSTSAITTSSTSATTTSSTSATTTSSKSDTATSSTNTPTMKRRSSTTPSHTYEGVLYVSEAQIERSALRLLSGFLMSIAIVYLA